MLHWDKEGSSLFLITSGKKIALKNLLPCLIHLNADCFGLCLLTLVLNICLFQISNCIGCLQCTVYRVCVPCSAMGEALGAEVSLGPACQVPFLPRKTLWEWCSSIFRGTTLWLKNLCQGREQRTWKENQSSFLIAVKAQPKFPERGERAAVP